MGDMDNIDVEQVSETARKGFDLKARLEGRGLRKGSITLYLDEEVGAELGWARERRETSLMGKETVTVERHGVLGELDLLDQAPENARDEAWAQAQADLLSKKDELVAELEKTALRISLQAVPPIIYRDVRRKAKQTAGITEKGVPDEKMEAYLTAFSGHLISVMCTGITDQFDGSHEDNLSYDDAVALMDYLPSNQYARLDAKIQEIQLVDQISETIESQEDFS